MHPPPTDCKILKFRFKFKFKYKNIINTNANFHKLPTMQKMLVKIQIQKQTHLQQSGVHSVNQVFLLYVKLLLVQCNLECFLVSGLE